MWHTISTNETIQKLETNPRNGLTDEEVLKRKQQYGDNKLDEKKKEPIIIKFLKQFNDFMIITLIIASIISAVMAYVEQTNDYFDSIIIIGIVMFNAIMGLIQESKAEKSLEALQKMSAPNAKVKRNGENKFVPVEELVPGDIVIVEAGSYIPADCRVLKSYNLKVEESTLTGETNPIIKDENQNLKPDIPLGDMVNMLFATTMVVNGHGEAVVTDTGMNTKVGGIAKLIISSENSETPLQRKLGEVGKKLGIAALVICFVIFVIGIFKQIPIMEMFMTAVGLAVAAIPEGLPIIVTIMLSIGVTKMAKKNAIIRRLSAVETLGSSKVICSDKTGTLTQNKMNIVELCDVNGNVKFSYNKDIYKYIIKLGVMCNDSDVNYKDKQRIVNGEPTEVAIINEGIKIGESKNELYDEMPRIGEVAFDSTRKLMTTIHKMGNKYRVITKGAPDVLIGKCISVYNNGNIEALSEVKKSQIQENNSDMASRALRVLAVAYKDIDYLPNKIDAQTIEQELIFTGLMGMIDPPREGVKEAIETCKKAGIKTVMITGDHILTAKAIATELGILKRNDLAITGNELDKIPQNELEKNIMQYSVFARVSPEHKVRIVEAFKSNGQIVAMTGDGVNDAPALKKADIGISMGKCGTDVAKNASDMILTDDNFVTIVEAVKQGRNIFTNITKAVHFLLATNIGEIVAIFVGLLLGVDAPLIAIQLLWINLITDSLPAIALGLEEADKNIMNEKPREGKKGFFADGLWTKIFTEGTMIGVLTLIAFNLGNNLYGLEVGRTMAFVSLGLLELVHSFNIRSGENSIWNGIFSNKYLIGSFIIGTILQLSILFIKPIADIFEIVMLNGEQFIIVLIISLMPIVVMELQKKANNFKYGKKIYNVSKQN